MTNQIQNSNIKFFKGFTLIELLIVIAIIGILSALIVPNFMAARERARDSRRKSDLSQVQKALELYHQDNNSSFPDTNGIDWGSEWKSAGIVYINKVPQDPSDSTGNTRSYQYTLDTTDSQKYYLCACLENVADSGSDHIVDCTQDYCNNTCKGNTGVCYALIYE